MIGFALRSTAAVAVLAQVPGASTTAPVQSTSPAPYAAPASPYGDTNIASTIAEWRSLQQTDALPFDSYARFLVAHPGWPGEAGMRRAAERQALTGVPSGVVAFFNRYPAQTASGAYAHARALAATGDQVAAREQARRAWRMPSLSASDESALLATFGFALTPEDHDARADALLWGGQTSAASRVLPLTSAARRPALEARLALRSNGAAAAGVATNAAELYRNDAGFIADRAAWLRNNGAEASARDWLARPRSLVHRPANVEKWYETLLTAARGAAADGRHQLAYDIARQIDDAYPAGTDVSTKPYGERDDYTSLAWLAGQSALRIGRPADAMTMFDRYGRGVKSPQTRAKGFYWAARAAERAGQAMQATTFYQNAAAYRGQYYGQLALEKLGQPMTAPYQTASLAVQPAERLAFEQNEVVRAARFLGSIGSRQDQTQFIKQIAANIDTGAEHDLALELSRQINRPDLAVMADRTLGQGGSGYFSAAGFPTVTVPTGYENNWVMIHAITRQESQFDRTAISHAGARGLMQLMPGTAREQAGKLGLQLGSLDQLFQDPSLTIKLGSSYFDRMYALYGSYPLAVAAYNAGPGNVNKWLRANGDPRTGSIDTVDWVEAIPFTETRNYVQRVLENAVVYDLLNPERARSRGNTRLSWYLGRGTRVG
ncbi:lytic transglycosylase domain-containing protein [Sphingomonas lenta]|uniref:Lytic transglycosylase n=1 Tax=Sphingomonas lenta TaxID=1141887 RepID=A0A2A2SGR2_9SPHN|nr:lytic transglycosylase domain-containing protein [Sphingomonas lenta]PAX08447.1 lytic transglycosylase [Sphingomonas lenta]